MVAFIYNEVITILLKNNIRCGLYAIRDYFVIFLYIPS